MTDDTTDDHSDDPESADDEQGSVTVEDIRINTDHDQRAEAAQAGRTFVTVRAVDSGATPPEIDEETAVAIGQALRDRSDPTLPAALGMGPPRAAGGPGSLGGTLATNAAPSGTIDMSSRDARMQRRQQYGPGRSHHGERDYWDLFGYPEPGTVAPESYTQIAERIDPANTVAYRVVTDSWKHNPNIVDDAHATDDGEADESDADGDDRTKFEVQVERLFNGTPQGKGLPYYWKLADEKQRPQKYSLLLLGLDDGKSISQPVDTSELDSVEDLRYCNVFAQSDVSEWKVAAEYELDAEERRDPQGAARSDDGEESRILRPDQPVLYKIRFDVDSSDGGTKEVTRRVHHSRIVHIVEDPVSEWLGRSCLRAGLNRFIDYQKIMGATAEAYFSHADRKYLGSADTSGGEGADPQDIQRFDEHMWEMFNGMRTTAYTENMDLEVIDGDAVDPSGAIEQLWPGFSTVSSIPQRIMKGSERGDLASSQDDANYYSGVGERQRSFNAPVVARQTIDRLIDFGVLDEPDGNADRDDTVVAHAYSINWADLFELTELEKTDKQNKRAQTFKRAEEAIAMGANRETVYDNLDLPQPDPTVGSESAGGSESQPPDETNSEVRGQYDQSRPILATDGGDDAAGDGGGDA